jgi:succinate dehydrogenase / fumarate reductase cytochrome b subunit
VAKGAGRELMTATIYAAERLGIQINDMKDATCCGAGVMDEDNPLLAETLNARTFSLAEEQGLDIMTICGTCQGVLRQAQVKMEKNPKHKEKVNEQLKKDTGRTYAGKVKVKHFYQVIHEDYGVENLVSRVTRKLSGLKIAPFYGCYVLRPHEYSDVKVADKPDYLEKLITAVGATPVDYAEKQKCCGFPILMPNKTNSLQLSGNAIVGAINAGADCIVTPCPLCHLNMDSYQPEIEGMLGRKLDLPILHYPQLLALALGASLDDIKANTHIVRPNSALREITA